MNGKPHIRVNMKPDAWAVQVVQKPSRVPGSVSAWPSSASARWGGRSERVAAPCLVPLGMATTRTTRAITEHDAALRSEEHTSELQSRGHLVCRLLLEKKK